MRKKLAAFILCALLVFQMAAAPKVQAAGYVYFVAAGESILPLSDDTMPFWRNGYLYVASSIFSGTAREALDVVNIPLSGQKGTILYSIEQSRALRFDLGQNYAYDEKNNTYGPGCVAKNGEIFVPVSAVAEFFGLKYTVTKISTVIGGKSVQGELAWIRKSNSPVAELSERYFLDAASFSIASRYEEYLRSKTKEEQPVTEPVETQKGVDVEGKRVYLCLTAGEDTEAQLNMLDRSGAQAAFFCDAEFLQAEGDLLRRMTATGHAVGILVDAADETRSVAEQLEEANRALEQATCGKTRLVFLRNGDTQTKQSVQAAGYRCMEPDLDRSGYDLNSTAQANSLLQKVLGQRGDDVTVWLSGRASAAGLRSFASAIQKNDGHCLAWTETA